MWTILYPTKLNLNSSALRYLYSDDNSRLLDQKWVLQYKYKGTVSNTIFQGVYFDIFPVQYNSIYPTFSNKHKRELTHQKSIFEISFGKFKNTDFLDKIQTSFNLFSEKVCITDLIFLLTELYDYFSWLIESSYYSF